jgi:ribosomal protein S18 acetylase RimI-like enzyme
MAMVREANGATDVQTVGELFREYARTTDAPCCFADFERELAVLPAGYSVLILAEVDGIAQGCVALRRLDAQTAEVKRLYVRPGHRGQGIGRALADAAIEAARRQGHRRLVLDSLPTMQAAIALYRLLGFRETTAYLPEPTSGALCFERSL